MLSVIFWAAAFAAAFRSANRVIATEIEKK